VHPRGGAMEANPAGLVHTDQARMRARLRELVRERPLLTVSAAAIAGALAGGVLFSRLGRLAFFAVCGYVANELWHREGPLAVEELIAKLSSR
jgi:hypothetical protein